MWILHRDYFFIVKNKMEVYLESEILKYIIERRKVYEIYVFDSEKQKIKLLDIIKFCDKYSNIIIKCMIIGLEYFNSFRDAIYLVGVCRVMPNAITMDKSINTYHQYPHKEYGTYQQGAKMCGVLRIKFEVIE